MELQQLIMDLSAKYPAVVSMLMLMGAVRLLNKPIFAFLHAFVEVTPSSKDNEILGKVENSKLYKSICFVLDYLFSVKLIK